ncbi:hypothetical protein Avbf_14514 [Armadillidium vulgare]|nr:hypothetical protein Avbf_14514 [Armadillidium vulgare]
MKTENKEVENDIQFFASLKVGKWLSMMSCLMKKGIAIHCGSFTKKELSFTGVVFVKLERKSKNRDTKIDQFLGTKRTDEQIDNIVNCTSFSYMKKKWKHNPPTSFDNIFLKTDGKVGSWKEDLPLNIQDKIHAWMKENLKQFGDDFKYKVE